MHKQESIRRVGNDTRLSQRIVRDVLEASHRLIEETLRAGEEVIFPWFGSYYPSQRQEGRVRHIRTGRTVTVPARMVARFRAGEILKRAVAGERRR